MVDPVTPAVEMTWRGKSYQFQLTLGALAGASGALKIPILEAGPDNLSSRPELFQRAVLLYAMTHRKFKDVTLEECLDAITGDRYEHYMEKTELALEAIVPAVQRLAKAAGGPESSPLAETPSGDGFGALESSTSDSAQPNSGS